MRYFRAAKYLCAATVILNYGCASTTIEIPIRLPTGEIVMARYHSTRDSDISGLHVEMRPDGTFVGQLEGASGLASPVWQAAGQAFTSGLEAGAQVGRAIAEGAVSGARPGP